MAKTVSTITRRSAVAGLALTAAPMAVLAQTDKAHAQAQQTTAEKSLYERLGGVFAIAAVVDHFSDAVVKNPIMTPMPSRVGITKRCGIRTRFNDTVGRVLIIISAMALIHTALTYGERAIQSAHPPPHSKLMNIGSMRSPAPAGAGAPLKKLAAQGGVSVTSCVLKRAKRNAQHTA